MDPMLLMINLGISLWIGISFWIGIFIGYYFAIKNKELKLQKKLFK